MPVIKKLSGWGNYPWSENRVYNFRRKEELSGILDVEDQLISRGLGRSYSDQAINNDRAVLMTRQYRRFLEFDETNGLLTCESGVSLGDVINTFAPRGWFPMITPGTKYVTIGGAIANDIHGKAHHVDGSFVNCVQQFTVLLADGSLLIANRENNSDIFWASFGGLGLLGIILEVTIKLRKIDSTYYSQKSFEANDLFELLDLFERYDLQHAYSVAWIDSLAGGPKLGRGVLTVGDIASREELPSDIKSPLMISPNSKLRLPFYLPGFSLNKVSIKILNSVIHSVQSNTQPYVHYEKFLFPLDALHHWNRGYGKKGFIQYQFVIPLENGPHNIQSILKRINASDQSPFLNVLKKFGEGEPNSILSFPREGYTFAIDFPIKKGLRQLIETLDQMVLEYGGRVYLGKDAFLTPENFRLMYPLFQNWLEVKKKYDPLNKFNSNISRRINLVNSN